MKSPPRNECFGVGFCVADKFYASAFIFHAEDLDEGLFVNAVGYKSLFGLQPDRIAADVGHLHFVAGAVFGDDRVQDARARPNVEEGLRGLQHTGFEKRPGGRNIDVIAEVRLGVEGRAPFADFKMQVRPRAAARIPGVANVLARCDRIANLDEGVIPFIHVAVERKQVVIMADADVIPVAAVISRHADHAARQGGIDGGAQGNAPINAVVTVRDRVPLRVFTITLGDGEGGFHRVKQFESGRGHGVLLFCISSN